jgi:adenylosuccinate lyase
MVLDYHSPLASRYCSTYIRALFSEKKRAQVFRKLWVMLAQIEKQLGLPIEQKAIDQMLLYVEDIDLEEINRLEQTTHHDVMAHILAFGNLAKEARKIIHLGATSCYVTDNADGMIYKKALEYLLPIFKKFIKELSDLALKFKDTPCVGYTHFQVAQPTTMGKRFCLWLQDLWQVYLKLNHFAQNFKLLGIKGATGTQSAFYVLFDEDLEKIKQMEELFKEMTKMNTFAVSGQTYSRLQDVELVNIFAELGACFHKMGTDIRLLSHTGELSESLEENQVGSSAMPHKKNPMLSERLCSLSRFLMQQPFGALSTHATQWLERSLDDSAIRRLIMPETFLTFDAVIHLASKILLKLDVNKKVCLDIFNKSLVAIAQEPLLMHLSMKGADRQDTHHLLKKLYQEHEGHFDDYIKVLKTDKKLNLEDLFIQKLKNPSFYTAACPIQVDELIHSHILPLL